MYDYCKLNTLVILERPKGEKYLPKDHCLGDISRSLNMTGALLYMFIVNQYNCHPRASAVSEGSLKGSSPRGFFAKAQNDSVSILIQIVGTPVLLSS